LELQCFKTANGFPLVQVVVIIVVSVVYFIVVLLSEVYMMLSTGKAKPKNKADKAKRDAAKQRGFVDMADAAISADAGVQEWAMCCPIASPSLKAV
jgi:hypothetical protein